MKFEIADWRFEVTWDGLLCQPIEREQAKAAKKSAARPGSRDGASESRESRDRTYSSNTRQTSTTKNLQYRER
jgi:hypothetical protein